SSQNQLDSARIGLEEIQAARDRIADSLKAAESEERRMELDAALEAASTQYEQARQAMEQARQAQETVMDLVGQLGEAASLEQAEAILALAEAAAGNSEVFAASVSASLEAVVQFEAGGLETGQVMAAEAAGLLESGRASSQSLEQGRQLLAAGNFKSVMSLSQGVMADNETILADSVVAGGPGIGVGAGGLPGGGEIPAAAAPAAQALDRASPFQ
ncbi:MAG: hypothetical protein ACOC9D_04035, partial [Thermodesulfobacteriota bacterium]